MSEPNPQAPLRTRDRWIVRLSFSFLIVAIVCGYEAFRGSTSGAPDWQNALLILGAGACFALFLRGTRLRHHHLKHDASPAPHADDDSDE